MLLAFGLGFFVWRRRKKNEVHFYLSFLLPSSFSFFFLFEGMSTAEEKLNDAASNGLVGEVLSLLKDTPGLDVNQANSGQWTALHSEAKNKMLGWIY